MQEGDVRTQVVNREVKFVVRVFDQTHRLTIPQLDRNPHGSAQQAGHWY